MNHTQSIVKEVTINAPVSKVWKALSEKEQINKWFMVTEDFDTTPGAKFHIGKKKDGSNHIKCTLTEFIPEKKISYTWDVFEPPVETLVTYEIEPDGDKTKLTLTHSRFELVAADEREQSVKDHTGGWSHFMNKIKEYIESNSEAN